MAPDDPDPPVDRTEEFLSLLGQHDRALYAFILAQVPDWADAQEIAQETRLRLWRQIDDFETGTDFGAWSRTIAHYLILAHRKKSKRRHVQLSEAFIDAVAEEVAATCDELDRRQRALQFCLGKLREATRMLMAIYYEGKESLRQIAAQVGEPFETVRKRIYRARLSLSECIERRLRTEEEE